MIINETFWGFPKPSNIVQIVTLASSKNSTVTVFWQDPRDIKHLKWIFMFFYQKEDA